MRKLGFSTLIEASPNVVWNTMLEPETYKAWTSEFIEGSCYEGSWDEGQRIRFLGPDRSGITSMIAANRPFEFISIKHLGAVRNGVDDFDSPEVRGWAPSFENYTFARSGTATELTVELDVTPEFEEYMQKTWPKALARLKAMCEGS